MIWRVAGGEQSNINRITVFMGKHICVKICSINVVMEVISSKGGYSVTLVVLLMIYGLHAVWAFSTDSQNLALVDIHSQHYK